jgi:hypothetical protein
VSDARRIQIPQDLDPPLTHELHYRRGTNPRRRPFRVSQTLINQQRLESAEKDQMRKLKHTHKLSKRRSDRRPDIHPGPPPPTLFERSLKVREEDQRYEWPRDFYQFETESPIQQSDHQ